MYENTDQALRLKSDYPESYQLRAEAHQVAAAYALIHGGDVAAEVAQGLQALADRLQHSPGDARDETLRARLLTTRARWSVQQGKRDPTQWELARAAAARATKLDASDPDARLTVAEVARYQVELRAVEDSRAEPSLKEGLEAVAQVLQQQPWNTFALATQGALWILLGRSVRDPVNKAQFQAKGQAALASALKQNRQLQTDCGALLMTQ